MRDRTTGRGLMSVAGVATGFALLVAACGDNGAEHDQNTLDPRGEAARKIDDLFVPFAVIAIVIGVLVVVGVIYAAIRFRAREGHPDNPKQTHGHSGLEIAWTIAPAVILVFMAVPTVRLVFDLAEKPKGDIVEVTVTAKQWWWEYEYSGDGFTTANEMHIPIGKPVYLTLKSDDVIHSFWVPNLAGKKDVVPGRTHHLTIEADESGEFLGQCAEYCGLSHANMRLRVIAEPQSDYDAWVANMKLPLQGDALTFATDASGPIARYGCTACHALDGVPNATARVGPNLTHLASRSTFAGGTFDLNEENLRQWIRDAPGRKPMQPDKNVGMPSFKDSMTDADLDALVSYLLERQ